MYTFDVVLTMVNFFFCLISCIRKGAERTAIQYFFYPLYGICCSFTHLLNSVQILNFSCQNYEFRVWLSMILVAIVCEYLISVTNFYYYISESKYTIHNCYITWETQGFIFSICNLKQHFA